MSKIIAGSGGGGGGGSARPPITAQDTLQSVSIVEFIDGICEGEIEGFATTDPLESIYLNDTVIKKDGTENFKGVTIDYRLGTQNQTYIPRDPLLPDEDSSAAVEYSVDTTIEKDVPVIRTITNPNADAVRVTIKVLGLSSQDPKTGDINGSTVALELSVKANGDTNFTYIDLGGTNIIKGKSSSPYERSYLIDLKQYGTAPYEIQAERTTPEDTTGRIQDTIQWRSYTELIYSKLRYPNTVHARLTFDARHFQGVPKRGYLLKGTKVKVPGPAVYDPVLRTYTGATWDGTFITSWTRNPAWIFYDLITNPRYGLGKEVKDEYIDKWNLFTIAKRCDELVNDGFGGQEPRYSLDLYLQKEASAKQVIQDIASNFDTMAFWHAGGIFTTQDAPKNVSALYTPANVIKGVFGYASSSKQTRYTVALVKWNDPDDFYRVATEYVEDRDGIERYGYNEKQMVALGTTSRGQAHRLGKRMLLTSRLETDTVSFSVGLEGLVNKPGDIIQVADPLKHNDLAISGRLTTGHTTTTLELDREVNLLAGETYTGVLVQDDATVITFPVSNSSGTTTQLQTLIPLSKVPVNNAVWSIYSGNIPKKEYRILWINEKDDDSGFYELSAVTYDPAKYALADNLEPLEPIYKKPFANTNITIPPTNVVVNEGQYLGQESIQRYLDISFQASDDELLSHHTIRWNYNDGAFTETSIQGNSYRIENAKEGVYNIEVFATNLAGVHSSSTSVSHTLGEFYEISAISITNLVIKGPTATTFNGKNAEFDWDDDSDTVLALSDDYNTGKGGQQAWFRDYMVKIYEGVNLLRTEYVTTSAYVYTFEKNVEDGGPFRNINIDVAARDYYGNLSNNATLTVSNPAPTTFSSITTTAGIEQIFVEYYPPSDPDYKYTRVYASTTQGFTPAVNNLVYEGADRVLSFPAAVGDWYIRLQGIDEFGPDGTTYSSEFSETVTTQDITTAVDTILADPGRNGDFVVESSRFIVVPPSATTPPTAVFAVGSVNGSNQVGIRGELLVDGSIATQALSANSITSDKIFVNDLSAVSADMGTLTAGTLKTSPVNTGYRAEISDSGSYPLWYGTGTKNSTNSKFYVDTSGNAYFSGTLGAADGIFTGDMTAGTININSGKFAVDLLGNTTLESVVIKNDAGNVIMSSGTGTEWTYLNNKPSDSRLFTNLLNIDSWDVDTTGTQSSFVVNGAAGNNSIILDVGPNGETQPIWLATSDGINAANGGWNHNVLNIVHEKTYRSIVWIKQESSNGTKYHGCSLANTNNLDGTSNSNPYFWSGDLPTNNKWYMLVGIIHGSGHGTTSSNLSGVYDPTTGERVLTGTDFKCKPNVTTQLHRTYQYYNTQVGDKQWFARPRFEVIDGSELSIAALMESNALLNSNTTPSDIGYTGDLNATNGATWGTNISNEPVSLNDINATEFDVIASQDSSSFISGNLIPNGNMSLVGPDGRPQGAKAVYGTNDPTVIDYQDAAKTILRLYSATDSEIGVGFPAFRVNPGDSYTIFIRIKASATLTSGFYFRIQELDTDLDVGNTHISYSTGESGTQIATRQVTSFRENQPIGPAWETYEFTYTPTSTAKWAAPIFLNWAGMGTHELHIDRLVVSSNADVTDYDDSRVTNIVEENNTTTISRPGGGSYSNNGSAAVGVIKIKLPQSWTNTMLRFNVDVFNYVDNTSFSMDIGGYNYTGSGGSWLRTTANLIGSTAANNRVRFGHDGNACCIYIGETSSVWAYPKITIRDFQAGHGNYARLLWEDGWVLSIENVVPSGMTSDIADSLIDAKAIKNQGALATLNNADYTANVSGTKPPVNADNTASNPQNPNWLSSPVIWSGNPINAGNIGTYMSTAAIGTAQIQNAAITNLLVANAAIKELNVQDLSISTRKVQVEAITVPRASSGSTSATLTVTASDFPAGTKFYITGTCNGIWNNSSGGATDNTVKLTVGGVVVNTGAMFVQGTSGGQSGTSISLSYTATFSGSPTTITLTGTNITLSNSHLLVIGVKK